MSSTVDPFSLDFVNKRNKKINKVIMSPPWKGRETYCFSPYVPLSVTKSCLLYNLKPFKIFKQTSNICKAHSDDVSCTRTITLLWIFLELFPFDYLQCYFVSAL